MKCLYLYHYYRTNLSMQKLLFLCSGNYYRSRFAEEYFNYLAEAKGLKWMAYSKGLSQNMPSPNNPGPISPHTLEALDERQINGKELMRFPVPIEDNDFITYDRIIALSENEHRPMLEARFNHHCDRVVFFEVGDLPLEHPKDAMNKISKLVDALVDRIY